MLEAASRGPTAIDEATGTIYVLRYREIELLLHEPRLRGRRALALRRDGHHGGPVCATGTAR